MLFKSFKVSFLLELDESEFELELELKLELIILLSFRFLVCSEDFKELEERNLIYEIGIPELWD